MASRQRGLVLLTLLLALTLASIALAGALDVWRLQRQRQQEAQLLFVGNQYRQAIQRYYRAGRTLPTSIADLLEDNRYPVPLHHLRRAYPDPITGRNDWQFMRQGDGFFGVYSSSASPTIKRAHFPRRYADFENATTYGEWRFFYLPPALRNRLTGAALDSATLAGSNPQNTPDASTPSTPNARSGGWALGHGPAALR